MNVDRNIPRFRILQFLFKIPSGQDVSRPEYCPKLNDCVPMRIQPSRRNPVQSLHKRVLPRIGRLTRFSAVGALGTVLNLFVMALLVHGVFDIDYVVAAVAAAEISILHNFVLQERFVFADMRNGINSRRKRLTQHLLFNNAEALVRLPVLILLVETAHVMALLAQAVTLAVAFVARFIFVSRMIYRPKTV